MKILEGSFLACIVCDIADIQIGVLATQPVGQ
jgi:hypothetical protein